MRILLCSFSLRGSGPCLQALAAEIFGTTLFVLQVISIGILVVCALAA